MLCEHCHKKKAVMHMICLVNGQQVEKWLCADCAKEFIPVDASLFNGGTPPKGLQNILQEVFGQAVSRARKKVTKDGFSENAARILEVATAKALELASDYIGTEHILWGILHTANSTGRGIVTSLHDNVPEIIDTLENWMDKGNTKNFIPQYSRRAEIVLQKSGSNARSLKQDYVGSEQLLYGLLAAGDGIACKVLEKFGITLERVEHLIHKIDSQRKAIPAAAGLSNEKSADEVKETSPLEILSEYGRNLNELARNGRIDPVIGRDREVERLIQILCRRTKNNPVIIGEAGVGKTAVAEGLAQKIVSGDVPEFLEGKTIFSLELGLLVAGAKYRGEFEEKLKEVLEIVSNDKHIILFIDELHTIVGAGSAEGSIDAANMIKPALARGDLQVIGATTVAEYRKHIEKDAALERRFQPVMVDLPSAEDCREMLLGLRKRYEKFHGVEILPEAISAAVELSDRYITDRNLPDKAIDLMDEACSRLRMNIYKLSLPTKRLQEELEYLQLEKEEAVAKEEFDKAADFRLRELQLQKRLAEIKASALKNTAVTEDDVAEVVSSWTGIPLSKLGEKESQRLLKLENRLHERVIGQGQAVDALSKAVRRSRAGFKDRNRPIGSFLFLGPTGVGKTELAKALAEELFGDERAMLRFDMSEYMEKHTTSRLIGSPPGYVGYDEGGQLTDAVRRKPYSVLLLDEIEKAHPDVFNLLLQIMEDGRLTDGQGRTVDFRNAVIIMTSNAGAQRLHTSAPLGFSAGNAEFIAAKKEQVLEEVKHVFRPEFLNRIDEIIVFDSLGQAELEQIADNMLRELNERMRGNELSVELTPSAKASLLKEGSDVKFGARPLRRALRRMVEDPVSDLFLAGSFVKGDKIIAEAGDDKQLLFHRATEGNGFLIESALPSKEAAGSAKGEENGES